MDRRHFFGILGGVGVSATQTGAAPTRIAPAVHRSPAIITLGEGSVLRGDDAAGDFEIVVGKEQLVVKGVFRAIRGQ